MPVLNCGLVCQYQNSSDKQIDIAKLDTYVQEDGNILEVEVTPHTFVIYTFAKAAK